MDHDEFGLGQSKLVMIDSHNSERDTALFRIPLQASYIGFQTLPPCYYDGERAGRARPCQIGTISVS
jgi:hypothetical protein